MRSEELEKLAAKAARAQRLLECEDFLAWRQEWEGVVTRMIEATATGEVNWEQVLLARGAVRQLRNTFKTLELQAAALPNIMDQLKEEEHNERNNGINPVVFPDAGPGFDGF